MVVQKSATDSKCRAPAIGNASAIVSSLVEPQLARTMHSSAILRKKQGQTLVRWTEANELRHSGRAMKTLLASIVIILGITTIALADSLYRCADGTFTNKAERQCAPYESTGIVRVQPQQPS